MAKSKPQTEPQAVTDALQMIEDFNSKIQLAQQELQKLNASLVQAKLELKEALVKADEHLPQATLWKSSRFGRDSEIGKVVILRQTPSGQVVCRFAGSLNKTEMKFKPPKHEWNDKFYATEKQDYHGGHKYLLDVPEEYVKAARKQNT